MLVFIPRQADHEDLIHDVAYDFYGSVILANGSGSCRPNNMRIRRVRIRILNTARKLKTFSPLLFLL
jgi:hypothetical protein